MRSDFCIAMTAAVVMALAGCAGGAPSEDEMKAALLLAVSPVTASDAAFESFEAGDCARKDAVYNCQVKAVLAYTFRLGEMAQDKRQPLAGTYVFMETADGWRLVR